MRRRDDSPVEGDQREQATEAGEQDALMRQFSSSENGLAAEQRGAASGREGTALDELMRRLGLV